MRLPWMMTCSDGATYMAGEGKPHPRGHGAFTRKLTAFVRERKTVSLGQALHSMTGLSAQVFSLTGRGVIAEGAHADLVVFDPAALRDEATYQEPHRHASGMHCVLVNGTLRDRRGPADARAGRCRPAPGGATALTVDLPDSLQAAIDRELARLPAGALGAAVSALSEAYAHGRSSAIADQIVARRVSRRADAGHVRRGASRARAGVAGRARWRPKPAGSRRGPGNRDMGRPRWRVRRSSRPPRSIAVAPCSTSAHASARHCSRIARVDLDAACRGRRQRARVAGCGSGRQRVRARGTAAWRAGRARRRRRGRPRRTPSCWWSRAHRPGSSTSSMPAPRLSPKAHGSSRRARTRGRARCAPARAPTTGAISRCACRAHAVIDS